MKLYVFKHDDGRLAFYDNEYAWKSGMIGMIELDIKKVNKWVKKEVIPLSITGTNLSMCISHSLYGNVRNVRVTYEEET